MKRAVAISVIDRRHLLVRFLVEADFLRVYTREKWVLKGQALKVHVQVVALVLSGDGI